MCFSVCETKGMYFDDLLFQVVFICDFTFYNIYSAAVF